MARAHEYKLRSLIFSRCLVDAGCSRKPAATWLLTELADTAAAASWCCVLVLALLLVLLLVLLLPLPSPEIPKP